MTRPPRPPKTIPANVMPAIAAGVAAAFWAFAVPTPPHASAAPAPEIEYVYDVTVRRAYNWPAGSDALRYGHAICDRVSAGEPYAQVMDQVRTDVTPSDEFAANYLVSNAVNLICPAQLWPLRNSAAHYQPPPG